MRWKKYLSNLLFGIYAQKGRIELSATLEELGIDDINKLSKAEKQATALDLLKARSGLMQDDTASVRN